MLMVIVGIDEVGRGCWAGPVTAAAVVLDKKIHGLKDSKLLTKTQRGSLSLKIHEKALAVGIGWASHEVVNEKGLTEAVRQAMAQALEQIQIDYDQVIIDGHFNFFKDNPKSTALVKADNSVPAVSAASIVAKVARDNHMAEMASQYPDYGFEKHVGYGTPQHRASLALHGVSAIHRITYKPVADLLQLPA
jgi:ribonuclease HII